jgi:hypothetical protein
MSKKSSAISTIFRFVSGQGKVSEPKIGSLTRCAQLSALPTSTVLEDN